ncbi:glutamate decarboxylase [Demequina mangrovi]|uniref:Glutamate decarboxylase n=1 Tax=Demequina mangrovi TaxID=1043493 RepID=A0A1H6XDV4_9MICO|nr:glutamate decarboxylase [Demequina mangrovi]SEJ23070.1 glutamate decarboxylase [Demequina mangrovi]
MSSAPTPQGREPEGLDINPIFAREGETAEIPRFTLPDRGLIPWTAYQLVHDEAMLDGNARLNLATFVTTWMDEKARELYAETVDKNMIDKDEYPKTAEIETRCWRILADLWHAPDPQKAIGTSTVGSSEAAMLAGLAMMRHWRNRRRAAGHDIDRPNLVMSSAVQVCWEKFCNYWDIEMRLVPVSADHPSLDGETVIPYVDERTIGVIAIMGVTYTGIYEPVAEICAALDSLQAESGLDVPVHVDGASGAFVAPFVHRSLPWDFRLPRVVSINASGHKYGLVYPGLGWVVWRDESRLPEDMIFRVSYLGGDMPTLALNFSRPGAQVLLQYYLFLRLGHAGYTAVQSATRDVAMHLAKHIGEMAPFELVSDGGDIPVFAWRLKEGYTENWTLYHLSDRLRGKGWLIPAYPLPEDLQDIVVQRIVVRNGFGYSLASDLLDDIDECVAWLDNLDGPIPTEHEGPGFTH